MPKTRVMIVDDEADITQTLKLYLERAGAYEVCEVNDGAHVLERAKAFRPDIVLLDVVMPNIDGGRIAGKFGLDEDLRGTPIVFLTAAVSREEAKRVGGKIGNYPLLGKPVSPKVVMACIEQQLQQRGAR